MNHGVIQGFPERQLDRVFLARDAMRSFDEPHQPFHQRRDGFNFAWYPSVDFEQTSASACCRQMRSQIAASIQDFHSRHDEFSPSTARQPEPIAHGIKPSKSLAVAQNAIPPVPLADETQNRRHGIFLLSSAFLSNDGENAIHGSLL